MNIVTQNQLKKTEIFIIFHIASMIKFLNNILLRRLIISSLWEEQNLFLCTYYFFGIKTILYQLMKYLNMLIRYIKF